MADPAKVGKPWSDEDLDAIVADYFAMLRAELVGQRVVKANHAANLMAKIGRTHKAIEFKHQNISAVLDELGFTWIRGYIPKRNYQNAIFPAIDRFLSADRNALDHVPRPEAVADPEQLFVAPPGQSDDSVARRAGLLHLVRKFDPVARDHRNRALGHAGEEFVLEVERMRLRAAGRNDLAGKLRWVADVDGDGAGFDIVSFHPDGTERQIEVKTTNGPDRTPFFLTRTEWNAAAAHPQSWQLYRVHSFAREPRIFTLTPPLAARVRLRAETWRASF